MKSSMLCIVADSALLTYSWPVQGLLKNFRPEVEKRIAQFTEREGKVLFGGHMQGLS